MRLWPILELGVPFRLFFTLVFFSLPLLSRRQPMLVEVEMLVKAAAVSASQKLTSDALLGGGYSPLRHHHLQPPVPP